MTESQWKKLEEVVETVSIHLKDGAVVKVGPEDDPYDIFGVEASEDGGCAHVIFDIIIADGVYENFTFYKDTEVDEVISELNDLRAVYSRIERIPLEL